MNDFELGRLKESELQELGIDLDANDVKKMDEIENRRYEKPYTFREYSADAFSTVMYPEAGMGTLPAINYTILALVGEAGETANKLKKVWRGDKPLDAELKAALADEIGDVLWYADRALVELGYPEGLEAAAKMNIAKLRDRRERGKTKGDGDRR